MVQSRIAKKEVPPNVIITIEAAEIKPMQQIRILGLLMRSDSKVHAAMNKINKTSEQILSMIRRLTNRNRGIKEKTHCALCRRSSCHA